MLRVAVRLPAAPAGGVKVRLIVHVAFAATLAPLVHVLLEMAKSLALVPLIDGVPEIVKLAFPVFLTVTVWAVLVVVTNCPPNGTVVGVIVAIAAVATPVPVRLTI
jgi:hypothetical protein